MSKILRQFISIVDADCDEFGGIMDEVNETELEKCSNEELAKILDKLKSCEEMVREMIFKRHLEETYDEGFEKGKMFMMESLEEPLM